MIPVFSEIRKLHVFYRVIFIKEYKSKNQYVKLKELLIKMIKELFIYILYIV